MDKFQNSEIVGIPSYSSGIRSTHVFMASPRKPSAVLSCHHYQIQMTQASLQIEGFPLEFAGDFSKVSLRSICTLLHFFLGHSVTLQIASSLR